MFALRIGTDHSAAAMTGTAGAAIDVMKRPRAVEASMHHPRRRVEHRTQLLVGDVAERAPRRDTRVPQCFRLPHVPDACDDALVEHGIADLARPRLDVEAREHRVELGWLREDVRAKVRRAPAVACELEHRAVPEHRLVLGST